MKIIYPRMNKIQLLNKVLLRRILQTTFHRKLSTHQVVVKNEEVHIESYFRVSPSENG